MTPEAPESASPAATYYESCDAAREAGAAPLLRGEPGYREALDREGDTASPASRMSVLSASPAALAWCSHLSTHQPGWTVAGGGSEQKGAGGLSAAGAGESTAGFGD
ncbi:excalibur calcium-binding domain-containing protein [Streptomyces sp. NPDC007945]|uniref:excalibur calcium-binding domain-containing protein n=1 Tax=Streptomyces sp. NPDC007945 TaxID=3364797 RepID=UPI0036E8EFB9